MSRVPGSPSSRKPPGSRPKKAGLPLGRLLLGWLLAIVVLGVAFAFTPLHDLANLPLGGSNANPLVGIAPAPGSSPTVAHPAQQIGADESSVTDTSAGNAPSAAAVPAATSGDTRFAFLLLGY